MTGFTLPLYIIPRDHKLAELIALAPEMEELATGDRGDSYDAPQAFTILITFAPHRLAEFAEGWYVDPNPNTA